MIYDCKKCGKVFKQKGHDTYHIGRIRPYIKEINNTQYTNTTNIINSQIPHIPQNISQIYENIPHIPKNISQIYENIPQNPQNISQIYENIPQNPQNIHNIDVNIKKNNKQILFNCINCNKNFTKKFNLDRHNIKGYKKKNKKIEKIE